jgi:DNA repair exonuclease SbcCD ATPase subunit
MTNPGRKVENQGMTKNRISLAAGLAVLLLGSAACVSKSKYEESEQQNQQLKKETENLKAEVTSVGAANTEAQATLDEVQKALAELRTKELKAIQTSIAVAQEGKASGKREELKAEIEDIRKAVRANLAKLATLAKQKKESDAKVAALEGKVTTMGRLVDELRRSLEEKEATLAELEQKVLQLQQVTEELKTTVAAKEAEITGQEEKLATAWVVVGTKRDLEKAGLVEKKGSILGLGGSWKQTGFFDEKLFRKIDVRKEKEFPFGAPPDKIRILSGHTKGSFELVTDPPKGSLLKVVDPDKFWQGSRYLIVLVPG